MTGPNGRFDSDPPAGGPVECGLSGFTVEIVSVITNPALKIGSIFDK